MRQLPLTTYLLGSLTLIVPLIYTTAAFDFTLHPRLLTLQAGLLFICICLLFTSNMPHDTPIMLPLLCFTLWSALSALWTLNPTEGLVQASRQITFTLVAYTVLSIGHKKSIRTIYYIAGFTALLISLIGIAQYFGWAFSTIPTVGNPSATFGYRNFAAIYLICLLPIVVVFAWQSNTLPTRSLWTLTAILMSAFLIYTRTRGAWMGLLGALLVTLVTCLILREHPLLRSSKKRLAILTGSLVVALLLGNMPDQMKQEGKFRFDERKTDVTTTLSTAFSTDHSRGRLIVWQHTSKMIFDHLLFGVGLGSWQIVYPVYDQGDTITRNAAPQRPHNDFLWILSETGLIGFSFYIWLLFVLFKSILVLYKREPRAQKTAWAFGIAVGLLAYLGHSCFSFPKERIAPSFLFYLGIGAIAVLSSNTKKTTTKIRPYVVVSILFLFFALLFSYDQLQFDIHYRNIQNAWRQKNWSGLISEADAANKWGPFNHRSLLLKGIAQQNLNNHKAAIETYQHAQTYHPNSGHSALAHAYMSIQNWQQAYQYQKKELMLFPADPNAWLDLSHIEEKLGSIDQAIQTLQQGSKKHSKSSDIYQRLGQLYQKNSEIPNAYQAYKKAIELNPQNATLHNNLGALLVKRQNYTAAEKAYLEAIRIAPNYARAHHNLGDLYRLLQDAPKARKAYQSFINTWQGDARFIELAKDKIQALESPSQ